MIESKEEETSMKTKRLLFISCLAAGALIASPVIWKTGKEIRGHVAVQVTSANDTSDAQRSPESKR